MAVSKDYDLNVFVNCPFDRRYRKIFRGIIFSVIDCGFIPKCAQEISDSSLERARKLLELMGACRLGVHDISRTQLDPTSRLPRFNMPLELGMFLAAKHFGSKDQKRKICVILDKTQYRYQKFISDIAGKDIKAHENDVGKAIKAVRDWLGAHSKALIPGAKKMHEKYLFFIAQLPNQCRALDLTVSELTFMDYKLLTEEWLAKYDEEGI